MVLDLKINFESYDTANIVKLLKDFAVLDLSTWYIRRSRDRISGENTQDRNTALSVLYGVLVTFSKLLAPIAPFVSEEIYKNLTQDESVHLTSFPEGGESLLDEKLIENMKFLRQIVEMGHAKRKEANIKLRQPLTALTYESNINLSKDLEQILADEVNVKKIEYIKSSSKEPKVELDTNITPSLKEEGEARDLIRQIQQLRKEQNLILSDKTKVEAPTWPKAFEAWILASSASISITLGEQIKVSKVEDEFKSS